LMLPRPGQLCENEFKKINTNTMAV